MAVRRDVLYADVTTITNYSDQVTFAFFLVGD